MRELQADRGAPLTRRSDVDAQGGSEPAADAAGPAPGPEPQASAPGSEPAAEGVSPAGETVPVAEAGPDDGAGPHDGAGPSDGTGPDDGAADDGEQPPVLPARAAVRRGRWVFAVVALVALAADILSKLAVVAKLEQPRHAPVEVVPHVLYLIHTRNTGAAFSLGTGYTFVLTLVAVAVIVVIIRTARRLASVGWAIALGLVLGGACGNVVDRLLRTGGGVIDFLALGDPYDPVWPVFNLADSALCCGVAILVVLEFTGRRLDGTRASDVKVRK